MEKITTGRRKRVRKPKSGKPLNIGLNIRTYGKLRKKRGSLTGVCAGLGEYFGLDPIIFRIGFIAASFFSGIGLIGYLALAIFLPMEDQDDTAKDGRFRLHHRPNIFDDGIEVLKNDGADSISSTLSVCPTCDTVSKPDSKFCHKCGTKLN